MSDLQLALSCQFALQGRKNNDPKIAKKSLEHCENNFMGLISMAEAIYKCPEGNKESV